MAPTVPSKKAKPGPKQSTLAFASTRKPSPAGTSRSNPISKVVLPPSKSPVDSKGKPNAKESDVVFPDTSRRHSAPPDASEYQLWAEKYAPNSREDLAVHKQKVEDVYQWLCEALGETNGGRLTKYRRVLALTGPSGVGKTVTVRTLAKTLDAHIVEWENTFDDWKIGDSEEYSEDRLSLSRKFDQFLARGNEYSTLQFSSTSTTPPAQNKRLLLIDDIPNIQNRTIRDSFHVALERFVHTPGTSTTCPLVIIISDAGLRAEANESNGFGWRSRQQETVNFRSVFPSSLQASPLVANVAFNPIASTLLKRGLTAVISTHYGTKGSPFSKEFIDHVLHSANGDIRSAITTLQFADRGQAGPTSSSRKKGDKMRRERVTQALIESISQREQSLETFHLLGKILYNKRYGDSAKEDEAGPPPPVLDKLPVHLVNHEREPSRVDLTMIYRDTPIDSSLLSLFVHQNYTLFCNEVDESDALSEWLSISDRFLANDGPHNIMSEYGFYLTSSGALHSLPTPVTRRNQKLLGAEYFEASRRQKVAESQVEMAAMWLSKNANMWQYPSTAIATEFSTILTCGLLNKVTGDTQPAHEAFSSFSEIARPPPAVSVDVDLEQPEEERSTPASVVQGVVDDASEGWLSDDGIEDW